MTMFYDFTGVYEDYDCERYGGAGRIDLASVRGTDMYCDEEARKVLMKQICRAGGYAGIHFIDSGNYHYMSRLFTDLIDRPFSLVLFDNHTDMQESMIEGLLSCGNWAGSVLRSNPFLQQFLLIGPPQDAIRQDLAGQYLQNDSLHKHDSCGSGDRILTIPGEELSCLLTEPLPLNDPECSVCADSLLESFDLSGLVRYFPVLNKLHPSVPVYLSVDKDILSDKWVCTNWDQGEVPLPLLIYFICFLKNRYEILGADICGEMGHASAMQKAGISDASLLNKQTNYLLFKSCFLPNCHRV